MLSFNSFPINSFHESLLCFHPESGKLITWGSTDDLGQSYVTSGKHGVVQHYTNTIVDSLSSFVVGGTNPHCFQFYL